jgi:hypothetical protein
MSSYLTPTPPSPTHIQICSQRPNPKSLTGGQSRLWHRVKVDSGKGMPKKCPFKCVGVDPGVDIRGGYSQLRHRVPYTMFYFGSGLKNGRHGLSCTLGPGERRDVGVGEAK